MPGKSHPSLRPALGYILLSLLPVADVFEGSGNVPIPINNVLLSEESPQWREYEDP